MTLALAGQTFGQSPALTYLRIEDPLLVALVDEALAVRLTIMQSKASQPSKLPADLRYATEADYPPE